MWRASRLANTKGTSGLVLRTRPSASMVSRQPISRALGEKRRTKFQTQDPQQDQQLPPPVAKLAHPNIPRTHGFSSDSLLCRKCIELRNTLLCNLRKALQVLQLRIWPHHNPHLYLDYLDSTWSIPWVPWCRPWDGAMREWVERGSNAFAFWLTMLPWFIVINPKWILLWRVAPACLSGHPQHVLFAAFETRCDRSATALQFVQFVPFPAKPSVQVHKRSGANVWGVAKMSWVPRVVTPQRNEFSEHRLA